MKIPKRTAESVQVERSAISRTSINPTHECTGATNISALLRKNPPPPMLVQSETKN